MKTYKYKILSLLLLLTFSVKAQKFDKKINESFKVNPNVTIVINAAHTDVDIETWNKNEVSVEAVIEVDGVSKKEAEEIFKKWKFEALANKNKVKIASLSDNFFFEFEGDYTFDFNFPNVDVEIPDFYMPEVHFPDFEFPEMPEIPELPEMDFEVFEFNYNKYKNDSSYLKNYKKKIAKQVKKFKNSDWKKRIDSIKNTSEYKKRMAKFKGASEKMQKKMEALRNSEDYKRSIKRAKLIAAKARVEMLRNNKKLKMQLLKAKAENKKAMAELRKNLHKKKFDSLHFSTENIYFFNSSDKKNTKVKITKYLIIKVPKKATFNLNVKHGKLKVPKSTSKMSANISYGNFVGGVISGENNELKFSSSPVVISTITSGNITLKNVPNATFGAFENANLFSNSSDVVIEKVGENVTLNQKFGTLKVLEITPNFTNFNVILDYSKVWLPFKKLTYNLEIDTKKSKFNISADNSDSLKSKFIGVLNNYKTSFKGTVFSNAKTSNVIMLKANYSTLNID